MDDAWKEKLRRVEWVVATGERDSLIRDNRDFAALLARQGQRIHAEFWPGVFGHDWPYWIENVRRFI
jgi:esterase/lipase superfamily enzyme